MSFTRAPFTPYKECVRRSEEAMKEHSWAAMDAAIKQARETQERLYAEHLARKKPEAWQIKILT